MQKSTWNRRVERNKRLRTIETLREWAAGGGRKTVISSVEKTSTFEVKKRRTDPSDPMSHSWATGESHRTPWRARVRVASFFLGGGGECFFYSLLSASRGSSSAFNENVINVHRSEEIGAACFLSHGYVRGGGGGIVDLRPVCLIKRPAAVASAAHVVPRDNNRMKIKAREASRLLWLVRDKLAASKSRRSWWLLRV